MPPCRDGIYFCNVPSASRVRLLVHEQRTAIHADGACTGRARIGTSRKDDGPIPLTCCPGINRDPGYSGLRSPGTGAGSVDLELKLSAHIA